MKKVFLWAGGSVAIVLAWWFIFHLNPLCGVTSGKNYTLLKKESSFWEMGGGRSSRFLYRIENISNFEEDLLLFFSESPESDVYVYTSYFDKDATMFSREHQIDSFSENSFRTSNVIRGCWWRCIFSENKKLCYIQIIKPG